MIPLKMPTKHAFAHLPEGRIAEFELTRDYLLPNGSTLQDAVDEMDHYIELLAVKHATWFSVFDADDPDVVVTDDWAETGPRTLKSGFNRNWLFRCYARNSKITGDPCLHFEFQFLNEDKCCQMLKINDSLEVSEINLETAFDELADRLVCLCQIDHKKLARLIRGIPLVRFRSLTDYTARQITEPWLVQNKIKRPGELVDFIRARARHLQPASKSRSIKRKGTRRPGPRSAYEKRIMKCVKNRWNDYGYPVKIIGQGLGSLVGRRA